MKLNKRIKVLEEKIATTRDGVERAALSKRLERLRLKLIEKKLARLK